jgi:hypothetical protein
VASTAVFTAAPTGPSRRFITRFKFTPVSASTVSGSCPMICEMSFVSLLPERSLGRDFGADTLEVGAPPRRHLPSAPHEVTRPS